MRILKYYLPCLFLATAFALQAEDKASVQEEVTAQRLIERFDKNGDGTLNVEELQEAILFLREQRMQAMRENRPERAQRERRDSFRHQQSEEVRPRRQEARPEGQGRPSQRPEDRRRARENRPDENPQRNMAARMIERFDESGDGMLNEEELANLFEWMRDNRQNQNQRGR